MTVRISLRTDADGRLGSFLDGQVLSTTPLVQLPSLKMLQADAPLYGNQLFAALGGKRLWQTLASDPDNLLLLDCDERADEFAWEFAALDNHDFLAVQCGMLRLLDPTAPPAPANAPLNFVFLGADPLVDETGKPREGFRLSIEGDLRGVQRALKNSGIALNAQRVPPTQSALQSALRRGPAILHLLCHGNLIKTNDGDLAVLYLEDENGLAAPLRGNLLTTMAPRGVLRLVLLTACHTAEGRDSDLARLLVANGVPCAIGMQEAFLDVLSEPFAVALYDTLLAGQTLAEALRNARQAIVNTPSQLGLPVGYTARNAWGALPLTQGAPSVGNLGLPGNLRLVSEVQPPRPILGRNGELFALAETFSQNKVVTITGTGGMGKTALAASFAERFAWRWADGVRCYSFASDVVDAQTFRLALLRELLGAPAAQNFADADAATQTSEILRCLRDWQGLLLIDNYESVLQGLEQGPSQMEIDKSDAATTSQAAAVHRLVAQMAEGGATLLLTSRQNPAGLRGEVIFPRQRQSLGGLAQDAAVALFYQHSTKAKENAETHWALAKEIADKTEGHPLAIALLAGEYDVSQVADADFLRGWADELASARRDGMAGHHVTFATAFARSYNHLTDEQKKRLNALSIIGFPFYAQGAMAIWMDDTPSPLQGEGGGEGGIDEDKWRSNVREKLGEFTRRNLLDIDGYYTDDTPAAYRFQPALRQELARKLSAEERAALMPGYAAYAYWFVDMARDEIKRQPAVAQHAQQAANELIALADAQPADRLARYCWQLGVILQQFGRISDAEKILERGVAHAQDQGDDVQRERILFQQARLSVLRGDLDRALEQYDQTASLAQVEKNQGEYGAVVHNMAQIYVTRGDLDGAMKLYQQSIQVSEQLGDLQGKAVTLQQIGQILNTRGDLDKALQNYKDALKIQEQIGDLKESGVTLHNMAQIYVTRGDLDGAMKLYQQSAAINEQLGDLKGKSATLHQMAGVFVTRGDLDGAMKMYQQSRQIQEQLGDLKAKARTLSEIANVHWNKGAANETENLLRQSIELSKEVGDLEAAAYNTVKLGQVAQARGDNTTALARYREGLALFERLGAVRQIAQVKEMIAELESGDAPSNDPIQQALTQARALAERGDVAGAIVAQEQVVVLMRQQGESKDALVALSVMLYNLGGYYARAERFGDAVRAMQEVVALDERTGHQDLESDRQQLQQFQKLAALTPEQLAQLKAQSQAAQQTEEEQEPEEADSAEAEMQAQFAKLPPEQRAQVEEAMRAFARMSPEEQAAFVAQQQRAQIQALADQVRDAGIAVRRGQAKKEELVPQLEQLASQIEQDQANDSRWSELAAFVRAVIALLNRRASLILIPGQTQEPLPPVPAVYAGHLAAIQR